MKNGPPPEVYAPSYGQPQSYAPPQTYGQPGHHHQAPPPQAYAQAPSHHTTFAPVMNQPQSQLTNALINANSAPAAGGMPMWMRPSAAGRTTTPYLHGMPHWMNTAAGAVRPTHHFLPNSSIPLSNLAAGLTGIDPPGMSSEEAMIACSTAPLKQEVPLWVDVGGLGRTDVGRMPMWMYLCCQYLSFKPQNQATNIVVNAGGGGGKILERKWSTQLCACMEDMGGCLCVMCFPVCQLSVIASRMDEIFLLPCLVPQAHMALRVKLRNYHYIEGSIFKDCFMTTCCPMLTMCQLKREMDNIDRKKPGTEL